MIDIYHEAIAILVIVGAGLLLFLYLRKLIIGSSTFRGFILRNKTILHPNAIGIWRVVLFLSAFFCAINAKNSILFASMMGLYLFSALADSIDGLVARQLDMATKLGEMLDPLFDKVTHIIPHLIFCHLGHFSFFWVSALIVQELIGQFAVRPILDFFDFSVAAKNIGKIKTVFIYTHLGLMVLALRYQLFIDFISFGIYVSIVLSFLSIAVKLSPLVRSIWRKNSLREIVHNIHTPSYFRKKFKAI